MNFLVFKMRVILGLAHRVLKIKYNNIYESM